jgi:hypothetical protein
VYDWLQTGFDWQLDLLNSYRSVTTSNYICFTNSRTLQFTTARTESSQSAVFTSRCLVATSNGGHSPYLQVPELFPCLSYQFLAATTHKTERQQSSDLPLTNWLHSTVVNHAELAPLIVLLTISRHGPHRKHRSSVAISTVACAAIGADRVENIAFQPVHWCMLEMCCLATGVVYRIIT